MKPDQQRANRNFSGIVGDTQAVLQGLISW